MFICRNYYRTHVSASATRTYTILGIPTMARYRLQLYGRATAGARASGHLTCESSIVTASQHTQATLRTSTINKTPHRFRDAIISNIVHGSSCSIYLTNHQVLRTTPCYCACHEILVHVHVHVHIHAKRGRAQPRCMTPAQKPPLAQPLCHLPSTMPWLR